MTKDQIKKALYREKPEAKLLYIKKNGIHYRTFINVMVSENITEETASVFFKVPLEDLGDAEWLASMPSQLLLRYLIY